MDCLDNPEAGDGASRRNLVGSYKAAVRGRSRTFIALVSTALVIASPAFAVRPTWSDRPYSYVLIDQDIRLALTEFGRNLEIPVVLSDAVRGRVRGEARGENAGAFLDRLCSANGLTWYFDGAVLHVSASSEFATRVIDAGRLTGSAVVAQMRALDLEDDRFSLRVAPNGSVITVSGPPAYVGAAEQLVQRMQPAPVIAGDDPRVRVFRGGLITEEVRTPKTATQEPPGNREAAATRP